MKKTFSHLIFMILILSLHAQAPQKMSYQCVVRNSSGALVTNQSVGIRISILQGTTTGTVVYQETYNPNPQTNTNGLVSIEIGGGLAITGTFTGIDWATGPYFLKTETDPTGSTNYTIVGISQLLSVPYAMYAKTAGNEFSGSYNDLTNKPILFSGNYNDLTNRQTLFDGSWANITGKPTSLTGYGITDGMSTSHVANGITSSMISNWNTAFGWGNHAGLYRPISYVPAWSEITSKPTTLAGYGITDAVNTTDNQTIAGNKKFTGTINASSQNITNVANPVSDQDAATKAYVDAIEEKITMLKNTLNAGGLVKDIDGNSYNTVVIGTQIWMAENLKTTKYNDGTPVPLVTDIAAWNTFNTPGYCWYNNDPSSYKDIYGALYNFLTTKTLKLCPAGWHLPSGEEWTALTNYLGGISVAGGKLKETGTYHWKSPNTNATNESGFMGLPSGERTFNGLFNLIGSETIWWASTPVSNSLGAIWKIQFDGGNIIGVSTLTEQGSGCSVRCIKD
jgi:uncharacterized protein (TIGR02145 family)